MQLAYLTAEFIYRIPESIQFRSSMTVSITWLVFGRLHDSVECKSAILPLTTRPDWPLPAITTQRGAVSLSCRKLRDFGSLNHDKCWSDPSFCTPGFVRQELHHTLQWSLFPALYINNVHLLCTLSTNQVAVTKSEVLLFSVFCSKAVKLFKKITDFEGSSVVEF